LERDATYFYAVEAENEGGNPNSDDNGGSCYTFITGAASDALGLEPSVPDTGSGTRNHYLAFCDGTPGKVEAVRIRFDIGAGERTMWVGEPRRVAELSGESDPGEPGFWAAPLVCPADRGFADWSVYEAVYVHGNLVIPGQSYARQVVALGCEEVEAAYSDPLVIGTSPYGDIVGGCADGGWTMGDGYVDSWTPPQGTANFDDITAVVDKFKNAPNAPRKPRADVDPAVPDLKVDFGDIPAVVDGFRELRYPYAVPGDRCPWDRGAFGTR
jgi:hypothetical protein